MHARRVGNLSGSVLLAAALASCGATTPDPSTDGGVDAGTIVTTPLKLFINEVGPTNATSCADEVGEFDDWIELFNAGTKDVDLAGFSITDDHLIPLKAVLTKGLVVPAGGYLVLWADGTPAQGAKHLPFKLSAAGEEVVLYDGSQKILDQFAWTNAVVDVSFARLPDGTGALVSCAKPTCGTVNGTSCQ